MKRTALALAALLLACGPAVAAGKALQNPMALLSAGNYAAASEAGRARGDAEGLAVAARADLVRAAFQAKTREDAAALVASARQEADAAVAKAPGNYLAQLQQASAIGYQASLQTSRSLSKQARDSFEQLIEREPQRPEAYVALGVWHGEAVLKLGVIAGVALGASKAKMQHLLAAAAQRDPQGLLAPGYRGLLLVRMGDYAAARPYLAQAVGIHPRDAHEADIHEHALEVAKLLNAGETRAAKDRANHLAAFGLFRAG